MKKFLISLTFIFLLFILSDTGLCEEREFDIPFNTVWYSVIEALTKAGDIFSSIEKESGLIVIKKEEHKLSEYDLRKITNSLPSEVEWQAARAEANIFVKPFSDNSTKVVINFKIIGIGMPYKLEKINDNYERVATDIFPREYLLSSNGRIERSYFRFIEQILSHENKRIKNN